MAKTGIDLFLDLLADHGVRYIFGNPGSTELPLNDALSRDDRIQYVLGLQEVPVMAMADGVSMASGELGVVNLHVCPGLGNAMGMLYNAFREGTPLLVTAGQQDRRLSFDEPIIGGQMVEVRGVPRAGRSPRRSHTSSPRPHSHRAPARRPSAALSNASNTIASDPSAVANAHAVLARSCTLNLPRRRSAALANTANSSASS